MIKKSCEKKAYIFRNFPAARAKWLRNLMRKVHILSMLETFPEFSGKFMNIHLYIILYVVTTSDSILSIHSYGYIVSIFKMMYE